MPILNQKVKLLLREYHHSRCVLHIMFMPGYQFFHPGCYKCEL